MDKKRKGAVKVGSVFALFSAYDPNFCPSVSGLVNLGRNPESSRVSCAFVSLQEQKLQERTK
jgi:hypothetical protein